MAELIARIKPRKSSVSGESPTAADLEVSEIAVNTADGKLFVKHTDNSIKVISGSGGGSGTVQDTARTSPLLVTTSSLADGAAEFKTLTGTARSGQFISIETSHAARVVYYSTTAARTADAARVQGTSPLPSSGVLLEVITTGVQTIEVTPAILYQNSEVGAAGELYLSITNLSGSAAAVEVETVVVPIEGRGIYMSEVADLLDVAATVPADGETLIYNGSAQEWQPGAVSLGIQDANDFLLNQELDPLAFNSEFTISTTSTGGLCQTAGNIAPQYDSEDGAIVSRFDSDGVNIESALIAYSGSSLYLAINGGASQAITIGTVFVYTGCAPASTHGSLFVGNAALKTAIDNAQVGDTVKLSSEPYTDVDLADGDILQWVDADSKFKPAQLPAVPVDSINGETGVVSLGVQDMDDFEKIAQVSSSHRYTLMPDTDAAWPTVAAGQYAVASDGSWLRFNYEDADGDTVAFTASADIWTTTNLAGSWTTGNANTTQDDGANIRYFFRGAGAAIDADLGATTHLSVINPAAVTYAPLADGDILQWVDTDSRFKPAQLAEVIDKATLKSEVAASTDFADFQSRIAAL